ncbi:cytochrome c oxidase assembly protein [Mesorhizobium sp. CGMCC 1.15528]|uniref:Cytochrome c oxidase assembly protein n=1 Tax=Mesorhizobium zhangyense TaxID=1776730 RepID=A0A7C9VFR7_9HYPH|nr:cytochrome c oxidase assembly protein [Mesorhizobium zhangyense]NGN45067.1 cytochrome c oxidase assembly protein [Mesorhizobium zhangyense]
MRRVSFLLGLTVLVMVWGGPLLDLYRNSFASHMLAHMGVVAIAAPLLAIVVSGSRFDLLARSSISTPIVASVVELFVVWLWHAPAMRALAERSVLVTVMEQSSFLAAGLFLWLSCIGYRTSEDTAARSGVGALGLLLTSVHMTLLGVLLSLAPRPLYGLDEVTCFGVTLSAQGDQHAGGVIMLAVGAVVYLIGGLVLLGRILSEPNAMQQAREP